MNPNTEDEGVELVDEVVHAGNHAEDITLVRAQRLIVDCDNEPAPENIPILVAEENEMPAQEWGP